VVSDLAKKEHLELLEAREKRSSHVKPCPSSQQSWPILWQRCGSPMCWSSWVSLAQGQAVVFEPDFGSGDRESNLPEQGTADWPPDLVSWPLVIETRSRGAMEQVSRFFLTRLGLSLRLKTTTRAKFQNLARKLQSQSVMVSFVWVSSCTRCLLPLHRNVLSFGFCFDGCLPRSARQAMVH